MTVFYSIIMGNTLKDKHEDILAFLVTLYMEKDILILNVYKTARSTTKTNKQLLLVKFKFSFRLKMVKFCF